MANPLLDSYVKGGGASVPTVHPAQLLAHFTSQAAPLSSADQKTLKSFQSLPQSNRDSSLVRLQNSAKSGDKEAARKLNFLVPTRTQNVPKEPDYTPHDLGSQVGSALYGLGKGVIDSYKDTAKTITSLPHAVNAAGIALASMAAGQHGDKLAKSKQAALDEVNKTPYGQYFGKTVAESNAKPVTTQLAGIGGKTLENVLNVATLGVGPGAKGAEQTGSALGKSVLKSEAGYVGQPRIAGQFAASQVHPEDALTMAKFIDHARGITKLSDTAAHQLEVDASRIAEHYNIGGKATSNNKLANAFDRVLTTKPSLLDHVKSPLDERGAISTPKGTGISGNILKQGALIGTGYGAAQAGEQGITDPTELAKTVGAGAALGLAAPLGAKLIGATASKLAGTLQDVKGAKGVPTGPGSSEGVSGALQGLKANPTTGAELAAENKAVMNERGSIGSKKDTPTPAIAELQSKVVSGLPKQSRADLIENKIAQGALQAKSQLLDRYAPIKELANAYEHATGNKLPIENNPYGLARLHAGTSEIAAQRVNDLGSLIREAPNTQALKDIGVAQRILTDRSGIKNPVSQETAQKVIDDYKQKLGPEDFKKTQETVQKVIAYHDTMLKELADNGIISKDSYDAIKAKNQNYFSKFDVVDHLLDNSNGLAKGKSFNVAKQDLIKTQAGTESKIADPIEATIRQTIKATDLINRNKVGQSLYKISQTSDLVHEVKGGSVPAGYEKISTFVDGNKIDLAVPKEVGESLKHLTSQQADFVTKAMSFTGNLLRKGATSFNVGFALVSNPMRDAQSLALNSKYIKANPVSLGIAWTKGFAQAMKQGDLYREFIANGGGQSTFFGSKPEKIGDLAKSIERSRGEQIGRTIVNPKQLFGLIPAIESAGQKFELAPRLAEYGAAKKAGASPAQAAFDARNVTVDFSQAGTVGQVMNQWVPFLNARLQGNVKSFEAIARNPGRASLVAGYTVAIPVISTYMWNQQHFNDVYQQIPQYVKDMNFVIIYGKNKDASGNFTDVIKIPKGDLGRVFGNTLESFMGYATGQPNKNLGQIVDEAISNASPIDFMQNGQVSPTTAAGNVLPPVVKAGIEAGTNYSFFKGGPIVPQSLQGLPNNEQVKPNTSKLAVALANATGQSPLKVENTVQNLTGGATKQFESPQAALQGATGRVTGAPSSNVTNQFYNVLNETTPLKNSASKKINEAIKSNDQAKAQQIASDYNKTLDEKFAAFNKQYGKYVDPSLKKTFDQQKIVLNNRSLSSRKATIKKKGP